MAAEYQIPKTHKAAVYDNPGTVSIKIEDVETPEPGPGEVLTPVGQIGGHEGVGVVVKMGAANENSPVKLGDHSVPSDVAAPLLCGGVTVYAALTRSGAQPGDWVVISGAGGGLGHLACQIGSRGMGYRILGIDTSDKEDFVVQECGAERFLALENFPKGDEGNEKIAAAVKEITDGAGAAAAVVCTAANAAYTQAVDFLKFNGTMVVVGIPEGVPVAIQSVYSLPPSKKTQKKNPNRKK
ncbi:putative alcohol dehydrogenase ii [Phaeomoniella chlamydospora]|uniref:Putative alcohol dehydrogenase ii n=1 Tax=Phaeomoniella chlamydospora TaxID=158046 RepID=A0A0G2HI72_PHACM|nr:putative alcohol dehydrogenase ii [Phaeomoniella chlamydospora]